MEKQEIKNPRYPHFIKILRIIPGQRDSNNPFAEEDAPYGNTEKILYKGKGRSYTDTTTEGGKNVDENKRKSSIPVRYDEWNENELPQDGDTIISVTGKCITSGIVKDSESDNNRTIIYWSLRRV